MDEKPHFEHPQQQSMQPASGQVALAPTQQDSQISYLQQSVQDIQTKRVNFSTDIIGLVETLTAAPTNIPTAPFEQIKLAVITGTTYLYVYDATNHVWKRVALS
jgi:hypothetical protein